MASVPVPTNLGVYLAPELEGRHGTRRCAPGSNSRAGYYESKTLSQAFLYKTYIVTGDDGFLADGENHYGSEEDAVGRRKDILNR